VRYGWGKGGFDPNSPTPADKSGRCDCSGLISWLLGLSRKPKPTRPWWLGTDNIYADATGRQETFVTLPRPEPGCIVVYPRHLLRPGHTGLVTEVFEETGDFNVVDCSSGMSRRTGRAIWERNGEFFLQAKGKPAVFCTLREWVA